MARGLFVADGYDAMIRRGIGEGMEYSPIASRLRIKGTETLIRELCEVDWISLARASHRIPGEPDSGERLCQIGSAYAQFGIEHPNPYRLMFMTPSGSTPVTSPVRVTATRERTATLFWSERREPLPRGRRLRPDCRAPHLIAQAHWGGVRGSVALHLVKAGDPWVEWRPLQDTAALVLATMIRGFTPSEGKT